MSERDREVGGTSLFVKRIRGTGNLTMRLEDGNGRMLERTTVKAEQIPLTYTWVNFPFARKYLLRRGRRYNIVFSASSSAAYHISRYAKPRVWSHPSLLIPCSLTDTQKSARQRGGKGGSRGGKSREWTRICSFSSGSEPRHSGPRKDAKRRARAKRAMSF